jgi:hypothetical protein
MEELAIFNIFLKLKNSAPHDPPVPTTIMMIFPRPFLSAAAIAAICVSAISYANAQAFPALTKGEEPTKQNRKATTSLISHFGPTGFLGWVYHDVPDTGKSCQLLVDSVVPGSPADGVLQKGV